MKKVDDPSHPFSETKRRLLEVLLRDERATGSAAAAPTADGREAASRAASARERGEAPLSFAQMRLWFLERWEPGSTVYNEYVRLRLEGPLDARALEASLAAVVARHDVLRTVFRERGGRPYQTFIPELTLPLTLVDLSARPQPEREAEFARGEAEELARPFDLASGPLARYQLVRLGAEEHALLVSVHHIVCDGWSLGIFMREVAACYEAFARGEQPRLAPLALQYSDYARWQRQLLQGPRLERQLEYWRRALDGAPPSLQLPASKRRPQTRTTRGATEFFRFDAATANALRSLAASEEATLFMALMAAFQAVLHRNTLQTDICVGTPTANRLRADDESLIGFFVNTVIVRTDLSGEPSFRHLVRRARDSALGAFAHQDVPFEQVVEAVQPTRDLRPSSLVQVMLTLQTAPAEAWNVGGLRITPVDVDRGTARFDLLVSFRDTPRGLEGALEYSTDLFDAPAARRLVGHLENLVHGALAHPDVPVSRLPMLSPSERHHLLVERNQTRPYPHDRTLHRLFETQAARTPEAVAVSCEGEQLTYGQLNRRANQLARHLRARGIGPGVLTAIALGRSVDMVVAIVATLKAGGAYVPLDPSYPADRLAFIIEDSGTPLVVTHSALRTLPVTGAQRVLLDVEAEDIARWPEHDLDAVEARESSQELAYVIYTSGSTGTPKGVLVTHANVARLFSATEQWFAFGPEDVWTLFASFSFDVSVWEMWGALLYGGRLVVVPHIICRSPDAFHDLLRRERVTVLNQTPSAFRLLIREEERRQAEGTSGPFALRWIIFAGEALDFGSLRPWYRYHEDDAPTLVNMYGITETTVHVTFRVVRRADVQDGSASMIGVPIPDLDCHVLDAHLEPVPLGVPGELYVGGPGVARGYLRRPDLTAQRFVRHPFAGGDAGERLYRSGDIVRCLPGGEMEYLGRSDFQVKIRGFRVELEEIEAALGRQAGVRESVVVVREDVPGDKKLVAYVVTAAARAPSARELRGALAEKLPHYMVPSAIVELPRLPLTANGKVDRRALPAPTGAAAGAPRAEQGPAAPSTELECAIACAWSEVLHAESVGVDENFFDAGGNSFHMVELHARLRERIPELSIVDLFKHPTVRSLAAHVASRVSAGGGRPPEPPPRESVAPSARAAARAGVAARRRLRAAERSHSTDGEE